MRVLSVPVTSFADQRPGTSGLRKKVAVFQPARLYRELRPVDLRRVARSVGDGVAGQTLVLGGDGRFYNRAAIQIILRMAAANGFGRVLVGRGGILSTPAASCVIRKHRRVRRHRAVGQPQPGRPGRRFRHQVQHRQWRPGAGDGDRGDLSPHRRSSQYRTIDARRHRPRPPRRAQLGDMAVEVIDPVADYAALMGAAVRFRPHPRACSRGGFRMRFDAMHAVTGPYAQRDPRGPARRAGRHA